MKPKVFFTKKITPEKVVELYDALGIDLPGKVAVKVHSGEKGNQNFLHPDFWAPMIEKVNGTVVECNTAYGDFDVGVRDHTASHLKLLELHGWNAFDVDLMDAEGPDDVLPVPGGKVLKTNLVGKHMKDYDSMLVLAHFKGHPAGGFGGALKQLSIGCASSRGKALIHSGGFTDSNMDTWKHHGLHRGEVLRGEDRLYQRHEEPFRGLRLLRCGRGPLHEGYRDPGFPGPGGHRPGGSRFGLRRHGRPGPAPLPGPGGEPPRGPYRGGRRGPGLRQSGIRAGGAGLKRY